MSDLGKKLISPHDFDGTGPVPEAVMAASKRIAQLRVKFVSQWTPGCEQPLTTREVEELFNCSALGAEWSRELYEARDAYESQSGAWMAETMELRARVAQLEEQRAVLLSEVREWMCDKCNTVYPGPPQEGVRCVICPKCNGKTAPRSVIEKTRLLAEPATNELVRPLEARVAQLEGAAAMAEVCPHCDRCVVDAAALTQEDK